MVGPVDQMVGIEEARPALEGVKGAKDRGEDLVIARVRLQAQAVFLSLFQQLPGFGEVIPENLHIHAHIPSSASSASTSSWLTRSSAGHGVAALASQMAPAPSRPNSSSVRRIRSSTACKRAMAFFSR